MLDTLFLILLCQLLGETLAQLAQLPIPGPVLGMLLLLGWLFLRGGVAEELGRTADTLLAHLSLLFVPAGVGVMLHWERVRAHWQALALALILGTLITLVVTALTMAGLRRLLAGGRRSNDG